MKAIVQTGYGSPDYFELKEIDMEPSGEKLWQVGQNRPQERVTISDDIKKRGFVPVGRLAIDKSAGAKAFRDPAGFFEKRHEPKQAAGYRRINAPPRVGIEQ